ncbi:MAG: LysR family transcriptional regulator [Tepidimonas ignava]|uniref:DNA-binding transcriptional LysR family regulator n=1 Tax=Tepidimonas ignava TaxID=114249 RepID=A0A4R3L832_9BURK|nr:LysR family transcriptional regulator [Tepidimonas ignava]MCX7814246.1 LysR family transcriptional regulator [Tepidimonas ignava]TCS95195.1 DNA-binding transcriptional LysR family regulator [Tepidimonas ignava]TSE19342.1 HTH-type transcriptional activator CmpR [Tepidimonas ignava]
MNKIRPPRVTFHQLRTLEAVVRLGSITRAAAELHLTQPTVSAQIHELQSALDTALVEPVGRGIRPTEAAQLLRATALDMFARWQRFEEDLQALHGLERGRLRIAGVTTTEYFIARWLRRYTDSHPGIDIELAVDNRDAVVRRLQQDEIELAVMMMPPDNLPLHRVPLMRNPLVLIGPAGHPWAGARRVARTALNGQALLMREPGSGTRLATEAYLHTHGLTPTVRATLGSNEAIKHAVAAGLGLAVVSRHALAADPAHDGVALLPVVGFPIERRWLLVWRSDRRLSLAAQRFVEHVRAHPPDEPDTAAAAGA